MAAYGYAAGATADLLRSLGATSDRIPDSAWSVREAAVHLICFARFYREFLDGTPSPVRDWDDLEVMNAAFFVALTEDQPGVLADLLEEATTAYSGEASHRRAEDRYPFHRGITLDVATELAIGTNELLMHGSDIAKATGQQFRGDEAAPPTLLGTAVFRAGLIPPDADRAEATLAFSASGRPLYIYRMNPAGATTEAAEPGQRYDCVVDGPPLPLSLWLGGRVGWEEAGLGISGPRPEIGRMFRR